MNIAAASEVVKGTVHDVSESVSAADAFWGVTVILLGIVAFFIVRDRNSISEALQALRSDIKELVKGIADLRTDIAKNYATKAELLEVHRRIDHVEGMATERRSNPLSGGAGP